MIAMQKGSFQLLRKSLRNHELSFLYHKLEVAKPSLRHHPSFTIVSIPEKPVGGLEEDGYMGAVI